VNRSHKQIRELARRLLQLHTKADKGSEQRISTIVNSLTQGRYSHTDILNRREVQSLLGDDTARFATPEEQELMWRLFQDYSDSLMMLKTFILTREIGTSPSKEVRTIGAYIETEAVSYVYYSVCRLQQRSALPPGFQVQLQPGMPPPLLPGFPVEINVELVHLGWDENKEGI
jgi:hypothetical protein